MSKPRNDKCVYNAFSLEEGANKHGTLDWAEWTGKGTKKGNEKPIIISGHYPVHWLKYSTIDESNTGTFWYLMNKIESSSII